jgi:hypothetical protein
VETRSPPEDKVRFYTSLFRCRTDIHGGPLGERTRWAIGITMRDSDRAWLALAGGVAAYDLIATDDGQLTNAARRYFKSQPIATASMILVTGLHLVGGIPPWCNPITQTFAAW